MKWWILIVFLQWWEFDERISEWRFRSEQFPIVSSTEKECQDYTELAFNKIPGILKSFGKRIYDIKVRVRNCVSYDSMPPNLLDEPLPTLSSISIVVHRLQLMPQKIWHLHISV